MATLLLHSPADVTRRALIALGLGGDPAADPLPAWPVYAGAEPGGTPDAVLTVYDTVGQDDGRTMNDGELQQHYGVSVRVRAVDHPTGAAKAYAIRQTLAESVYGMAVTIDSVHYLIHCFSGISAVASLGKEATSRRVLFTVNALVSLRRLS